MIEAYICPIHNKAMRQNRFGWSCATPVEKDMNGGVLKWCDYKPTKETKPEPMETREKIPQRDYENEARGKCRSLIVQALIQYGGMPVLEDIATKPGVRQIINKVTQYMMSGDEF